MSRTGLADGGPAQPIGSRGARRVPRILIPALAALLAWLLVRNLALNLFHAHGAYYLDVGWFAYTPFRNDWLLTSPPGHPGGQASYLRHHLALFFLPLNALSYLLDTDHVGFFSLWFAGIYAFGFAVGYRMFRQALTEQWPRPFVADTLAALCGLLFAFNGIGVATLLYPHPEILMAFALAGMLWALARGRTLAAAALAAIALSTRTDGGFHIAIFCGATALGTWIDQRFDLRDRRVRSMVAISLAAFIVSCVGFWLQARYLPGGSQFRNIYSGPGNFEHLTWPLLAQRAGIHFSERLYVFAGFLGCLAAFAATRRWIFLAGAAAGLPWYLVNLVALSDAAGSFYTYYGFPFVVLLVWPLVHAEAGPREHRRRLLLISLAALGLSVWWSMGIGGNGRAFGLATRLAVSSMDASRLRSTLANVVAKMPPERTRLDSAAMSLAAREAGKGTLFFPSADHSRTASVVYFDRYMDTPSIRSLFAPRTDVSVCSLHGTELRVITTEPEDVRAAETSGMRCEARR